jgi:Acyl-CoA reductase (LuxC)
VRSCVDVLWTQKRCACWRHDSVTATAAMPAKRIVRAVAGAAERWSDADFPPRVRTLGRITARTRYSVPVVEYALDRLFFSLTEDALQATIRDELGSLEVLDGFAPRANRPDAWAAPIGRVCVVSSRTTIGVALVPAIFALCAKCDVLVKDREDALIAAFFESLCEEGDAFAGAATAMTWNSADELAPSFSSFDAVVVFGGDETLRNVSATLAPSTRFIGYGSRASAGYIAAESLGNEPSARALAEGAARDLVLYESEGCLSLHVLFVEKGGNVSPDAFAQILGQAVERANIEFPVGPRDPVQTSRVGQHRDMAAFRAAAGQGAVYADASADYAVVAGFPEDQPPPFLPRTLGVLPVATPAQALQYLREHSLPLEGFALSCDRADLVGMAVDAGAVRLARFGELQHPPLAGDHGGRPRIAEFVRWIDKTL